MGSFRFRKQIKLLPGLKLNINKNSVSLTAGVRGAHATLNSKGQRTLSAGIPGTGLSYRDTRKIGGTPAPKLQPVPEAPAPEDDSWQTLWESVVNGTYLLLATNTTAERQPNFFLYADEGVYTDAHSGVQLVGIYFDALSATNARRVWEDYLRTGGSVTAWLNDNAGGQTS